MGISIQYVARRQRPLSTAEEYAVDAIVARFPRAKLRKECNLTVDEYDGEDFSWNIYGEAEPGEVFGGSTKLPYHSEDAFWSAVRYWCRLLSEVRRVLPGCDRDVHLEDANIQWDNDLQEFDPSAEPEIA